LQIEAAYWGFVTQACILITGALLWSQFQVSTQYERHHQLIIKTDEVISNTNKTDEFVYHALVLHSICISFSSEFMCSYVAVSPTSDHLGSLDLL
jgi:hypothetical protein